VRLEPSINDATIRLLNRLGCEVVIARGTLCCGALVHHLGMEKGALSFARANIDAWEREREERGLDAIVANASGCGTMLKDYGFVLREDPAYAEKAARIATLVRDVSEAIAALGLPEPRGAGKGLRVAYHSACSLQHGQRLHKEPRALLAQAGFDAIEVPEGHLCCGSAGTYNLLQPEIAERLRERKLSRIASLEPDLVAAGNVGCIVQLERGSPAPVLHTVELLDWATGGPVPAALAGKEARKT
jgi:glycolate oxidase iron-sulfur subunit